MAGEVTVSAASTELGIGSSRVAIMSKCVFILQVFLVIVSRPTGNIRADILVRSVGKVFSPDQKGVSMTSVETCFPKSRTGGALSAARRTLQAAWLGIEYASFGQRIRNIPSPGPRIMGLMVVWSQVVGSLETGKHYPW